MHLIEEWITRLGASGLKKNTVLAYSRDVLRIRSRLDGVGLDAATPDQFRSAFRILRLEGLSHTSLKRMHCAIQKFLYFLEELNLPYATAPGVNLLLAPILQSHMIGQRTKRTFSPRPYDARKYMDLADPAYLRERYLTLRRGTEEIATEVGCTKQAVFKALRAHGIETRSHSQAWRAAAEKEHTKIAATPINEDFFSDWSPAAAYALGVILTDGTLYLSKAPDGSERFGSGRVKISQKETELLDKVAALIGHSGKLTFQPRREYQGRVAGALYTLTFSSDKMVADLVRLGLHPRKSLSLQFPDMPAEMRRHFIRGCWDGDGSVFMEKGAKLIASFVSGSKNFVARLREVLRQQGVGCSKVYQGRRSKNVSYSIKVRGVACGNLYDFLYHGVPETMWLSRKRRVFTNALGREPIEFRASDR